MQGSSRLLRLCHVTPVLRVAAAVAPTTALRQRGPLNPSPSTAATRKGDGAERNDAGTMGRHGAKGGEEMEGDGVGFSTRPRTSVAAKLKSTTGATSAASPSTTSTAASSFSPPPSPRSAERRTLRKPPQRREQGEVNGTKANRHGDGEDVDDILAGVSTARTIVPPKKQPPSTAPTPRTRNKSVEREGKEEEVVVVLDEMESVSASMPSSSPSPLPTAAMATAVAKPARDSSSMTPLELTRRSLNVGETVTSGAASTTLEQIERRRSKYTVHGTEFEVGITERLFPDVRRLPALHEVHFGDAMTREVDSCSYFASLSAADAGGNTDDGTTGATSVPTPLAALAERGGDDVDDDDAAFAQFDAETEASRGQAEDGPQATTAAVAATNAAEAKETTRAHLPKQQQQQQLDTAVAVPAQSNAAMVLPRGTEKPWFMAHAADAAVRLHAVPPSDCLLLLRFLLQLRSQTMEDLPKATQRKAAATEAAAAATDNPQQQLSMADVIKYLDSAPPPVIGLTENLHDPLTKRPPTSPAFLFTLYMENVSFNNAVSHLAGLFSVPIKSFASHSTPSKMSCSTILCCVARNTLRREHLLLVNTLRLPGFVLRVSDVREVTATEENEAHYARKREDSIVGELARWDPIYEAEMLLRRVSCSGRHELEHRLRAVQQVGAVFYTAIREPSVVRAATDVLHGFYKSAVVNALHRPRQPKAMKEFLLRPNIVTASRARMEATDLSVKQLLRAFTATNGDWKETLRRVPFAWRRRWLTALRSFVWNKMASQRIRAGGSKVLVGDAVVRPEYREDVHRRMVPTILTEHIKIVATEEEAAACSLEDVFLPFLRGAYPSCGFAPDETHHPIMTERNMLAFLREHHAPQLLLGMTEEAKLLLGSHDDSAALLWRRLLIRPIAMEYEILEDKAPIRSVHFDAGRILTNDRWEIHNSSSSNKGRGDAMSANRRLPLRETPTPSATPAPSAFPPSSSSSLLPQSFILEKSTIGARLPTGLLAEEFFTIPSSDNYVVLGQAQRNLDGAFVPAKPHTAEGELGDRLYTVHIRAMTRTGIAGITQVLREYFILSGIEQESDSALQHKVHRIRRELDPETPLLTAPVYCEVCYNRDHHDAEACAEYFFKRNKRSNEQLIEASLKRQRQHKVKPSGFASGAARESLPLTATPDTTAPALAAPATGWFTAFMELHLRRPQGLKWGVNMTASLRLTGLDDPSLVKDITLSLARSIKDNAGETDEASEAETRVPWPPALLLGVRKRQLLHRSLEELQPTKTRVKQQQQSNSDSDGALPNVEGLLSALLPEEVVQQLVVSPSPPSTLSLSTPATSTTIATNAAAALAAKFRNRHEQMQTNMLLRGGEWRMAGVNGEKVSTSRDVARVFVKLSKSPEVRLTFAAPIHLASEEETATAAPAGAARQLTGLPAEDNMQARQRWLRELPDTLHVVLTKTMAEASSKDPKVSSWGVRLHTADMTLMSLSQLLAKAMEATLPPPSSSSKGNEQQLHVSVSLTPPEVLDEAKRIFSAASEQRRQAFEDIASALDGMYNLTRINGVVVSSRQTVATTLNALRQRIARSASGSPEGAGKGGSFVHLPLVLKRRPGSYTVGNSPTRTQEQHAVARESTEPSVSAPADAASPKSEASSPPMEIVQPLLPCALRQLRMSPDQQHHSLATLAINRLVLTPQTAGKWGLKIQKGTRRLKYIQFNRFFTFQVFAAKRNHAVRMQDTLRFLPRSPSTSAQPEGREGDGDASDGGGGGGSGGGAVAHRRQRRDGDGGDSGQVGGGGVKMVFSYYAYFINAVNHEKVATFAALREALRVAALPRQYKSKKKAATVAGDDNRNATTSNEEEEEASALMNGPESVTLNVKQYRLMHLTAVIKRGGGPGEPSPLAPVGLSINNSLVLLSVEQGSPMATAILQATGEASSLRRVIGQRAGTSPFSHTTGKGKGTAGGGAEGRSTSAVVVAPILSNALEQVLAAAGTPTTPPTIAAEGRKQRAWQYELDEDSDSGSVEDAAARHQEVSREGGGEEVTKAAAAAAAATDALSRLATVCGEVLDELDTTVAIDAVHLLQASLLQDFALSHLHQLRTHRTGSSSGGHGGAAGQGGGFLDGKTEGGDALGSTTTFAADDDDGRAEGTDNEASRQESIQRELKTLLEKLDEVHDEVCWRVVYATKSGTPLRTTQEVANVIAPGVAEEGLVLQQCLVAW